MRAGFLAWSSLAIAGVLLSACSASGGEEEKKAEGASSLTVTLVTAQPQALARSVLVSGPVSAYEEMQLGVELSGQRVTALKVDVGQTVSKGQVLLELDHRTLDSELAQAEASMRQAQASLDLARISYERGAKLAAEQLISAGNLDELRATRVQAEAQLATARAGRDAAKLRRDFAEPDLAAARVLRRQTRGATLTPRPLRRYRGQPRTEHQGRPRRLA